MTPYPFLASNLDALEKENPSAHAWLKDRLSSLGPSPNLVQSGRGHMDWMLPTGKSLFGSLPPRRLYTAWRIPEGDETATTIVIGCNLGYGLNHLLPKTPCRHQVLVLEPRAELLLAALGYTDYRPFLEARRLLFLPPDLDRVRDILSRLVLPCLFGKIFLRVDLPSLQLGPEYALWMERCREILEDMKINAETFRSKQDQMIENEMRNMRRASREWSPAGLRGKARGMTGVVLGAGPSLERFAPALKGHSEEALFSTSFQALPSLHRLGLRPHFAMIIDPNPLLHKVYEDLDAHWAAEVPLLYSTVVCPEVVRDYPGPTIPIWTITGLARHFRDGEEPVLDVGGNVGVALVRFLRWCGIARLLLVGQDFSWTDTTTHAGGHLAAGHPFRFDPRVHMKAKNRMGQDVFTAQAYLTPLRELERDLEHNDLPVFDLYGGGLPIRGSSPIGLDDLRAGGVFAGSPGEIAGFTRVMKGGLSRAKPPFLWRQVSGWPRFFRSAGERLKIFSSMHPTDRREVVSFLDEVLRRLQKDPLRRPYLMNEVIDLAGLIYKTRSFGHRELGQCMEIIGRAERKMQEMERHFRGGLSRPPDLFMQEGRMGPERAAA